MGDSLVSRVVSVVEDFARLVSSGMLKQTVESYSMLHSVDSEFAYLASNGALVSVARVRGVNTIVGDAEYQQIHESVSSLLAPFMREYGHRLQWTHYDDPALLGKELAAIAAPYERAAATHGLDFEDIFRERRSRIGQFCSSEWTYLTIWTYPEVMSDHDRRRALRERQKEIEAIKKSGVDTASSTYTQRLSDAAQPLRERHHSFVAKLMKEFIQARRRTGTGYVTKLLNTDEAGALLKATFDCDLPHPNFKLWSRFTAPPIRAIKAPRDDRGVLPPLVREQLFSVSAEDEALDIARVGRWYVASVSIQIGPMERLPFDRLVSACKGAVRGMPWRVTISMQGGGMGRILWRSIAARTFAVMSANKPTLHAINELEERDHAGLPNIALQVMASTWASTKEQARMQGAALGRAIQSWGICTPADFSGDAIEDAMASVGGTRDAMSANVSVFPLEDVTRLLPMRPVSPWEYGAMLTRTADGRLMPMQPGQDIQQVAIEAAIAPPGFGKSVLLNARHFAALLSPRALSIPFISILDVGPSSRGFVELVRSRLPAHAQHLATYAKIRNDVHDATCRINLFDLHLGFRKPLARDRDTIINILSLLITPAGGRTPEEGVELCSTICDYLYRRFGEVGSNSAKVYEPTLAPAVAKTIVESGISLPPRATWYEVVDLLFQADRPAEAAIAQRFAVPVLQDVLGAIKSPEIATIYSGKMDLLEMAYRMIQAAINDYPIVSQPTTFDISTSRIVVLDLDEVARGDGVSGKKLASLCYALGFTVATRRFNLRCDNTTNDLLTDCVPEIYHGWWRRQIKEVTSAPMQLSFDEFHRTGGLEQLQRQAEIECREGRKRGINVMFASQDPADIPEVIAKTLVNGIYLLGGPPGMIETMTTKFGLSDTQRVAVSRYCTGPSAEGSALLAIHDTSAGRSTQLLTLTLGPIELWAYSTTPEDSAVRNRVTELLGTRDALRALAMAFPSGSARSLVAARELGRRDLIGGVAPDVIGQIADEVVSAYRRDGAQLH